MADRLSEHGPDVVVVTGAGGMGVAIARRLGSGRTLYLAVWATPSTPAAGTTTTRAATRTAA